MSFNNGQGYSVKKTGISRISMARLQRAVVHVLGLGFRGLGEGVNPKSSRQYLSCRHRSHACIDLWIGYVEIMTAPDTSTYSGVVCFVQLYM